MPGNGINVGYFADIDNFGDFFDYNFDERNNTVGVTGVYIGQMNIDLDAEERRLIEKAILTSPSISAAQDSIMPIILNNRHMYLDQALTNLRNKHGSVHELDAKIQGWLNAVGPHPSKSTVDQYIAHMERMIALDFARHKTPPTPIPVARTSVSRNKIQALRREINDLIRQHRSAKARRASKSEIDSLASIISQKNKELQSLVSGGVSGFKKYRKGIAMQKITKEGVPMRRRREDGTPQKQMPAKRNKGTVTEEQYQKMYEMAKKNHLKKMQQQNKPYKPYMEFAEWKSKIQKRDTVLSELKKVKDLSPGTLIVINREIRNDPNFIDYLQDMLKDPDPAKRIFIEMRKSMVNTIDPSKFRKDKGAKQWNWMRRRVKPAIQKMPSEGIKGMGAMGGINFGDLFGQVLKVAASELNKENNQKSILSFVGVKPKDNNEYATRMNEIKRTAASKYGVSMDDSKAKAVAMGQMTLEEACGIQPNVSQVVNPAAQAAMIKNEQIQQQAQAAKLSEESAEALGVSEERQKGKEQSKTKQYAMIGGGAVAALAAGIAIILIAKRRK